MIFYLIFFALFVGAAVIKSRINNKLEIVLTDFSKGLNGKFVKSWLYNPKLIVSLDNVEITISSMVAGSGVVAGGFSGGTNREYIWYVMTKLDNKIPFFYIRTKKSKLNSLFQPVYITNDQEFDKIFTVYWGNNSDSLGIEKLFNDNFRNILCQIVLTYDDIRVDVGVLNNTLSVSVPFNAVKNRGELKSLAFCIRDLAKAIRSAENKE